MPTPTADEIEAAIQTATQTAAVAIMDTVRAEAAGLQPGPRAAFQTCYPTMERIAKTNFEAGARWCLMYLAEAFQPLTENLGRIVEPEKQKRRGRR